MNTDELVDSVIRWGRNKNLNDPKAQLNKVMEEVGEIAHEVSRNRYGAEFRDAIGDTLVTVIILADIASARPMGCLEVAFREIKNRKGKTENGTFIKEDKDELYDSAKAALKRLSDKKYKYFNQDGVYDDLRAVEKFVDYRGKGER